MQRCGSCGFMYITAVSCLYHTQVFLIPAEMAYKMYMLGDKHRRGRPTPSTIKLDAQGRPVYDRR